jgi:hypothetical protein
MTVTLCILAGCGAIASIIIPISNSYVNDSNNKAKIIQQMVEDGRSTKDIALAIHAWDKTKDSPCDDFGQKRATLATDLLKQNSKMTGEEIERIVKAAYPTPTDVQHVTATVQRNEPVVVTVTPAPTPPKN